MSSSAARERILAKLRMALVQAPGTATGDGSEVAAHYAARDAVHRAAPHADGSVWGRLQRLVRAMTLVQTEVHLVREADWPARLARVVRDKGVRCLLLAPNTAHGAQAVAALASLAPHGVRWQAFDRDIEAFKTTLFQELDAAFTRVRSGIADTGSLVLWPDADEPRTASLVPPIHVALFDGATPLHAHLHEAMAVEGWAHAGMPSNALLVSGPSKTSDIQQTLAYGAHGPRQLVLLLVVPPEVPDAELAALAQLTGAQA